MEYSPSDCEYFSIFNSCPYRDEELMRKHILEIELLQSGTPINITNGAMMASGVYEAFCRNCKKRNFKQN